jgi:hypothetical protein
MTTIALLRILSRKAKALGHRTTGAVFAAAAHDKQIKPDLLKQSPPSPPSQTQPRL